MSTRKVFISCKCFPPRNQDDRVELAQIKKLRASRSTYRTAIMCLGMMQAFKVINDVDIEWPPMFKLFAGWFSLFSFTFDFFKPECSVKSAYWKSWLGMTMMPYLIMFPLIFSYFTCKIFMFEKVSCSAGAHSLLLRRGRGDSFFYS